MECCQNSGGDGLDADDAFAWGLCELVMPVIRLEVAGTAEAVVYKDCLGAFETFLCERICICGEQFDPLLRDGIPVCVCR